MKDTSYLTTLMLGMGFGQNEVVSAQSRPIPKAIRQVEDRMKAKDKKRRLMAKASRRINRKTR